MTSAAIYARKSTDQHIFIDDGISGTEFKKRPAFMRMMGTLTPKAPFRKLIVSEQKSIGREMSETAMSIKTLAQAGVEIFEYVHGHSLTPTTPAAKLLSSGQGFSDEDHAVKTSERVIEAHTKLFAMGRVVGGRVFGYDNRHVFEGKDASGNPRGRTSGTQTRRTTEVREACGQLVDDPEYREALRRRMINGTAGGVEILIWHYAKGKPVDRVETGSPGAFAEVTNDELKARLRQALALP